jgi:hypothetical protein
MDGPPLASLSLTHVHYVRRPSQPPAVSRTLLTLAEPGRPRLVCVRMARPRPAGPVRRVRDVDMVEPRD